MSGVRQRSRAMAGRHSSSLCLGRTSLGGCAVHSAATVPRQHHHRNMYMGAAREASFTRGICREPLYPRAPSVPGTLPDVRSRLASSTMWSSFSSRLPL
ncbi:uncharacterized protein TRAVEDRAFT_57204 [Trametes versicolor FP-101664 SS1]|uniref:uncharacterized protein n=1 Tax=Trametes versicolor (strain FP-101664) TaxID=717944 RepID=UPI00046226E8|nr:uncharacterized protein TRAVEDRAFT_57204 [Trametes versicolor FP-101664 SS1]EIW62101.1 hypothetical protein TRAVEDRAFT_57204 [Trametes versicolor FP-101664 SS1]